MSSSPLRPSVAERWWHTARVLGGMVLVVLAMLVARLGWALLTLPHQR